MRYSKLFVAGMAVIALGACSTYPSGQQDTSSPIQSSVQPGASGEGAGGNFSKNEYPTGGSGMTKDAGTTETKDAKAGK